MLILVPKMYLQRLSIVNFKNYEQADFEFINGVNCFVGHNGSGKSNVLEAIYYLSFCKGYFNGLDSQNILFNQAFFVIQGNYLLKSTPEELYCGFKRNQKKIFKRNQNEYEKLSEHIGGFPLVMISPYDNNLITEGSEERRKFVDGIISQLDKNYLNDLLSYNKLLAQRNSLLKQFQQSRYFDKETLEIYNSQLEFFGSKIFARRKQFIEEFAPVFNENYQFISSSAETVALNYESQLSKNTFAEGFDLTLEKDRLSQFTNFGIHKDDFDFLIKDNPLKKFGSQGQQKSFIIALKLAQFKILKQTSGKTPVLLLDDIYDKLDDLRIEKLMSYLTNGLWGQVFVTDTNRSRIEGLFQKIDTEVKIFEISNGAIIE